MVRAFFGKSVFPMAMMGGMALVVGWISTIADTSVVSASAAITGNTSLSLPMKFGLVMEGPAEACGNRCRPLISASGMITADTPRQFQTFIRDNGSATKGGATVVLESDGGSVLGALDLGRLIRRLGYATTVGRVVERRSKNGTAYGELASRVDCQSMCTFVLLGGVHRAVPPDARVLVHQIWLGDRRDDADAANYTAEDLMVVQRDIGSIMQYTVEMGGDAELVVLSLKVPPWEPMRVLSRDELRRTHLDLGSSGDAVMTASLIQTAAGPTSSDDETEHLANEHGWVTVNRDGQPALARTHPLTFEGDRIGTFDLFLSCGAAPQTFALTYRETRTGSTERGLPRSINRIVVSIEDQVQPLKIGSFERRPRRGEADALASAVLPARLVRALAGDGPASMTLETETVGNPRTVIRVGNAGFARNFAALDKSCGQASNAHAEVRAQIEQR
jgi:hypothetical protein